LRIEQNCKAICKLDTNHIPASLRLKLLLHGFSTYSNNSDSASIDSNNISIDSNSFTTHDNAHTNISSSDDLTGCETILQHLQHILNKCIQDPLTAYDEYAAQATFKCTLTKFIEGEIKKLLPLLTRSVTLTILQCFSK
jgi:hypothetical protein